MSEMFRTHVGQIREEELALYVIGALDFQRRDAVESHVLVCEVCAAGLAREARIEAALEQVAHLADERVSASSSVASSSVASMAVVVPLHVPVVSVVAATVTPLAAVAPRARDTRRALHERSRWAGGVAGALAAAAALVLAFASATAPRAESASVGMSQRVPGLHDAAGDMSGAFGTEVVMADALDGG